jgi:hypothetical protein
VTCVRFPRDGLVVVRPLAFAAVSRQAYRADRYVEVMLPTKNMSYLELGWETGIENTSTPEYNNMHSVGTL